MLLFSFYRLYISLAAGVISYFLIVPSIWISLGVLVGFRIFLWIMERVMQMIVIDRQFQVHEHEFKQLLGPYGIRMINKAEKSFALRKSLYEVFTPDSKKLKKAVEQLTVMDTLFQAGMRPDAETYQLHDLKLKYGKHRLEEIEKQTTNKKAP